MKNIRKYKSVHLFCFVNSLNHQTYTTMKKLFFFVTIALFFTNSFGSSIIVPTSKLKATEVYLPIGKTGKKISLMELSTISMDDLQTLTGRKMNFGERIAFRSTQRKLKKNIATDGTIEKRKLEKFFVKRGGETGFHVGGFALGFLLGLIGLLIAYLINDDYKHNRVKWAWIGFGIVVVLNIILIAAAAGASTGY